MSKEEELSNLNKFISTQQEMISACYASQNRFDQEINKILQEMNQRIKTLEEEKQNVIQTAYNERRRLRELEAKKTQLTKELEEERHNKLLREKFKKLQENSLLLPEFPWSELILNHQNEGSDFITFRKRMILADVMGLGKTLTAIAALDKIAKVTEDATVDNLFLTDVLDRVPVDRPCGKKILYLSSAELSFNVFEEMKHWAKHRNVIFLTGFPKLTRRVIIDQLKHMSEEYVVILNYEGWRKDLNILPLLGELEFDTVILDEGHKLKDRSSVSYRGVASILSMVPSFFRIILTGTPVLNKPQELYSLLTLLDPYRFYSEKDFLNEFCTRVEDKEGRLRWTFKAGGVEALYRKVGPIILRRTKSQAGITLPEKTIIHHNLEVDEEIYADQARARNEMRKWGSIALDPSNHDKGFISAAAQIAVLTRLRQIETWPAGISIKDEDGHVVVRLEVEESQKLDYIINPIAPFGLLTDALESEEKVIVFSQFTNPLKELYKRCKAHGLRVALFTGETSRDQKEFIKKQFDASMTKAEDCAFDILLANYKVGGEGQNFTNASQMIILDEEWNPGKRDQAYDRLHRIGQQKPITIHVLRDINTVDEWLAELIKFKEEMVGGLETALESNAAFKALKEGKI